MRFLDESYEMQIIEKEREKNLHRKRIEAKKKRKREDKYLRTKKKSVKKKYKRWHNYDEDE